MTDFCRTCGAPISQKNKSGLCRSCNGKIAADFSRVKGSIPKTRDVLSKERFPNYHQWNVSAFVVDSMRNLKTDVIKNPKHG